MACTTGELSTVVFNDVKRGECRGFERGRETTQNLMECKGILI